MALNLLPQQNQSYTRGLLSTTTASYAANHQQSEYDDQKYHRQYSDQFQPAYQLQYGSSNINNNMASSLHQHQELNAVELMAIPMSLSIYNGRDQHTAPEAFEAIVQDYLGNLSSKKRDKALIDQARYNMILQVLKNPRNTAVSTAQFRFWVKKMFQLYNNHNRYGQPSVCHDGKPVAMREQLYDILVGAHREAHHGGRDKTSALVRKRYSWIPKELIARFVRHCPFCISRRNGTNLNYFEQQQQPETHFNNDDFIDRQREPSLTSSSSCGSSTASQPEEIALITAATAFHQKRQQQNQKNLMENNHKTAINVNILDQQQQQILYPTCNNSSIIDTDMTSSNLTAVKSYLMTHPASLYRNVMPCSSTDVDGIINEPMTFQPTAAFYLPNNNTHLYTNNNISSSNKDPLQLITTSKNSHNMPIAPLNIITTTTGAVGFDYYSQSLSPSSSTTSALPSSPIYPAYFNVNDKASNVNFASVPNEPLVQHKHQQMTHIHMLASPSMRLIPHPLQEQRQQQHLLL
ncbi:hypothetical protein BDF20DRAFT_867671 [Mycotypha africana]|uniref:uncharacterized protein n=1 Tax=Mycotypha africana TaxID=64632 RepID=UPI00230174F3|nr:uncharacterized protein BDF20DRAFT_867671 [Mycotypha africana]KAI8979117.1 hypothetical protein BDF20DRAFT_867671 [Mycotypha africana]